ncbi:hypothetical protein D9M68_448290 [compost metagenome]
MQCPKCRYEPSMAEMQRSPADCVQCGINYEGYARSQAEKSAQQAAALSLSPAVREARHDYPGAMPVVVLDINMSFWSMVKFMVKWVIAAIPALLILLMLGGFVSAVFSGFSSYSSYKERAAAASSPKSVVPDREPLFIPSDSGAKYYVLSERRVGPLIGIITRRDGPSGATFSHRYIDCSANTVRLAGSGSTEAEMDASVVDEGVTPIEPGSITYYIARRACAGV